MNVPTKNWFYCLGGEGAFKRYSGLLTTCKGGGRKDDRVLIVRLVRLVANKQGR